MKLSTSKNVHILIAIFVAGFLSLFALNQIFSNLIDKLDVQTTNYENKIKIGEFISQDILELKSLYYQLSVVTTSSKSRKLITNKLHLVLNKIQHSIQILEFGGILEREVSLNVIDHANIIKKIKYIPSHIKQTSLELIDIKPELLKFNAILKRTNQLLSQRVIASKSKYTRTFLKFDRQLKRYYKTTPAFFNRMGENIKRLLFEGDIELNKIKREASTHKYNYMIMKLSLIISILIIVFRFGYSISSIIKKEEEELLTLNTNLKSQERSVHAILNGQKNMVIVSNGVNILNANDAIADFFTQFDTVEDFTNNHKCICDMFEEDVPNHSYIIKKDYNGLNWLEHMLKHPKETFKVIMNNGIENHHFVITANKKFIDDDQNFIIIVSLNDVTSEVNAQKQLIDLNDNLEAIVTSKIHELQDLNDNLEQKVLIEASKAREKDKQMMQQARFAAMGEMIGNIAHQWRQPLSAINTTASGMQLQMQLDLASEDEIKDSYQRIMNYVDFLTQTIEDFRNFFHEDKEKIKFDIIETIEKTISITSATYKDADITLLNTCSAKPMQSLGMPNELSQVFLNILTNAKDAIVSNNIKNRLVSIQCSQDSKNNIIMIQDNAEGIPTDIIEKIFDPYFTTKHQTQGTGIGLYMSKDIVENHMFGQISVKNVVTTIDNHTFNGACFKISIPRV